MSIKLIYMRTGEEVISEVKEIAHPESGEPIGYHMHKPFRLDIVQQNIEFNSDKGYQLEWFPWAPLSKDRDFFIPGSQVITVYEPLDSLVSQYISAIDETRYEENFRKHEARFNLSYEDLDLDDMFDQAEKMLNELEEEGDGDSPVAAEDGRVHPEPSGNA